MSKKTSSSLYVQSTVVLSLIWHLAILAGLEAQSPSLKPMETQSESGDRERHNIE